MPPELYDDSEQIEKCSKVHLVAVPTSSHDSVIYFIYEPLLIDILKQ